MGFTQAVKTCLSKYVTFSGRAARSEFWWFALFVYGGGLLLGLLDLALFGQTTTVTTETSAAVSSQTQFAPFSSVFGLLVVLPYISVTVRRLHDTDRSGWWYWLALIPLIGIIVLIVWLASKGTPGRNRFGEEPLGAVAPPN
ncbi:DUF805 domain-containing protein [Salipiger sp. PrR002]|uniref:DUF805 domain-containing protein n=1 Tax=Salipiger sp. PrR002 TaxID=2706489 RepID=UPI0013B66691|nr:DUF805 domain-containing protein [Salipiger sp. PrR002]NDV98299.1 DUF805 domain-containing protein [Salipiger sp. PrR002]NDW55011.1 DUF805 domain-containing protein [Salipiger sp. PrR004]